MCLPCFLLSITIITQSKNVKIIMQLLFKKEKKLTNKYNYLLIFLLDTFRKAKNPVSAEGLLSLQMGAQLLSPAFKRPKEAILISR